MAVSAAVHAEHWTAIDPYQVVIRRNVEVYVAARTKEAKEKVIADTVNAVSHLKGYEHLKYHKLYQKVMQTLSLQKSLLLRQRRHQEQQQAEARAQVEAETMSQAKMPSQRASDVGHSPELASCDGTCKVCCLTLRCVCRALDEFCKLSINVDSLSVAFNVYPPYNTLGVTQYWLTGKIVPLNVMRVVVCCPSTHYCMQGKGNVRDGIMLYR